MVTSVDAVNAREYLLSLRKSDDPFDFAPGEVREAQMAGARAMFDEMRPLIPVLDKRATSAGITAIENPADLVPLLLSHTTYKSYPESFIQKKQWDRLLQWLGMVSTGNYADVDMTGVENIDDWIDIVWAAGVKLTTSSGTTGKVSMVPKSDRDQDLWTEYLTTWMSWPVKTRADNSYHYFHFGPSKGPSSFAIAGDVGVRMLARSDSANVLLQEPLLIARVSRIAAMRQKMKEGTATADEIAAFEEEAREQTEYNARRLDAMIERILVLRHQPLFIAGAAAQVYQVVERGRERGIADGGFHPDTILTYGGGVKHFKLPADWENQIKDFFGDVRIGTSYGFSEMSWPFPRCEAGNYHLHPWVIPLVLDESGETLLASESGIAEGRFGVLDLSTEIRWGGVISGDKVTVDLSGTCTCGRKSANIRQVARYADLAGDDKIECSGTIDAYIRGSFSD